MPQDNQSNYSLREIVLVIAHQERTGILTIQSEHDIAAISFVDGRVVAFDALNEEVPEALVNVLFERGYLSPDKLVKTRELSQHSTVHELIKKLQVSRILGQHESLEALRRVTIERIQAVSQWSTGEFKFYSGDEVGEFSPSFFPISVFEALPESGPELVDEGARADSDSATEELARSSLEMVDPKTSPVVFISYARQDISSARRLYEDIKIFGFGLLPWIDYEDIGAGEAWSDVIRDAIRESALFLALLSSRSVTKRGFVQKEIRQALDVLEEMPANQVFLIPVRLDECEPSHPRLRDLQWIDLFPDYISGFKRILDVCEQKARAVLYSL